MDAFLRNTASYIYQKYGSSFSDCAMVFPNRRAGLFFTRYLSQMIDKPLWLPPVLNISDIMQQLSPLQPADPVTLNFKLYRVFQSVTRSNETFDQFYNWGEILLSDFDEIDKYMVNAGALFRNVRGLKNAGAQFDFLTDGQIGAIKSFWSTFHPKSESPQQKEFLRIWEALEPVYTKYKEMLQDEQIAYEGMIFRDVADKVKGGTSVDLPYNRIFVAGFNALSECEKILFDRLKKEGRVEFFWDYDEYYTSLPGHQAGFFMRDNLKRYPHTGFEQDNRCIEKNKPVIEIVGVPSNNGQAKLLSRLKSAFVADDPSKTAVILPDEGLLLPVLSSLPDEACEINVTMGYPLKDTPWYGLVMQLIALQKNARTEEGEMVMFHHRDVLALLRHPGFKDQNEVVSERLTRKIAEENLIYLRDKELHYSGISRLVFRKVDRGIALPGYLTEVMSYLAAIKHAVAESGSPAKDTGEVTRNETGSVNNYNRLKTVDHTEGDNTREDDSVSGFPEKEFIYRISTGIGRLRDILEDSGVEPGFDTMVKLLKKVLHGIRVPFYGEPLGGVQVMGVLETRALDFENVIWLSVNEGVFPARQNDRSFVPYNLRKGYGLPGTDQQDAVYAYYFYRILQRAGKTTLVWNTRSEGLFTGEMSRFIYQLKFDRRFRIKERSFSGELLPAAERPVIIEKTPGVMRMMNRFEGNGPGSRYLSPGAVNSYLDCSLRFYFRYVARIPEPAKTSGEIDMAEFGSLMHKSAQLIYLPFNGKEINAGDIDFMLADNENLEKCVTRAFNELIAGTGNRSASGLSGMNRIVSGVLITYIKEMLSMDRQLTPFRIEGLEKEYRARISAGDDKRPLSLNLGGIIDRVDEMDGTVRVVDYKTGGDESYFSNVGSLFGREDPKRNKAVFQIFLYAWLYIRNHGRDKPVKPLLYQVKKFFSGETLSVYQKSGRPDKKPVDDFTQYLEEFEDHLKSLLSEMFSADQPFSPAADREICRYCIYNKLCHRG